MGVFKIKAKSSRGKSGSKKSSAPSVTLPALPPAVVKDVLQSAVLTHHFREFLRSRKSEQHMLLLESIQVYKTMDDQEWRWKSAKAIIDKFVAPGAEMEVGIAESLRSEILQTRIFSFARNTFDKVYGATCDYIQDEFLKEYSIAYWGATYDELATQESLRRTLSRKISQAGDKISQVLRGESFGMRKTSAVESTGDSTDAGSSAVEEVTQPVVVVKKRISASTPPAANRNSTVEAANRSNTVEVANRSSTVEAESDDEESSDDDDDTSSDEDESSDDEE